jgi:hypothetical protein
MYHMVEDSHATSTSRTRYGSANDNGQTFGSLVMLSAIGTVSSDC